MLAAARGELPPELWNRLDEVLCYAPLTRDEVAEIARRLLDDLATTLEQKGVGLQVDDGAVTALLDGGGFDPSLGARPMRRAIMRSVEAPLAEMLLRGELPPGAVAVLGVDPRSRRLAVTVGSGDLGCRGDGIVPHHMGSAEGRAASA
jgi:ATP-dependent Clp protease ATP-binding subunit ClpC